MNKILVPLGAVIGLVAVAWILALIGPFQYLLGVILPGAAFFVFLGGFIYKVMHWGKSPVPYRIPTTCGQEWSMPWVPQAKFDNPSTTGGVVVRMLLEIFLFRSLFRNTKTEIHDGPKLVYGSSKYLWLFGILFHYSFLVVVLRHWRLFIDPVPGFVGGLEYMDGIFQVGLPRFFLSGGVLAAMALVLFLRRVIMPQVRYISLPADYFPLFLIFAIAATGILMRYALRVDITAIKQLTVPLTSLIPFRALASMPNDVHPIFFVHVTLVSVLMVYFPFSKLMHLGGVVMSPTRNLPNNSRAIRHINPWNDPNIKPHSYAHYEDDFREFMVEAGIPVEKELPAEPAGEEA